MSCRTASTSAGSPGRPEPTNVVDGAARWSMTRRSYRPPSGPPIASAAGAILRAQGGGRVTASIAPLPLEAMAGVPARVRALSRMGPTWRGRGQMPVTVFDPAAQALLVLEG